MADVSRGAAPGEFIVRDGERSQRMYAAAGAGTVWVFCEGAVFRVDAETRAPRAAGHHHASLTSPMPATVITVNVAPGQAVTRGQILIVLEAMKMELPVRAPGDGIVSAVHCRPGELVQPSVPLIDIAPGEPGGDGPDRGVA